MEIFQIYIRKIKAYKGINIEMCSRLYGIWIPLTPPHSNFDACQKKEIPPPSHICSRRPLILHSTSRNS